MAGGKTDKDKEKDKKKADTKKKPSMKDILAKKSTAGGKGKKKKWSKTKNKEKLNNAVFFTKSVWDRAGKDLIAKEPYLTPSVLSDKLKLNVSLCRLAIQELLKEGKITAYNNQPHSRWGVYVKSEKFIKEQEAKPVEQVEKKEKKGKK